MITWQISVYQTFRQLAVIAIVILGIIAVLNVHDALVNSAISDPQPNAQPRVPIPEQADFQTLLLGSGLVVVDLNRGYVFLCTNAFLSGFPPIPQGQCSKIGSVGTSTLGFTILGSEQVDFFIINKTTDIIFQCVTA